MKRFKLTLDGIRYDLSEGQFELLSHRKLTYIDPLEYHLSQRIKSLVKQGLIRKWNGSFERTQKGFRVWRDITNRRLKREKSPVQVIVPSL